MEQLLLKPSEAADALGLGRSKTYQLITAGEIPSIRIGKSIRVPIEALRRWAAKQVPTAKSGALLKKPKP